MHVGGNKVQGIKGRIKRPKGLVGGRLYHLSFGACSRGNGGPILVSLGSPVFGLTGTNCYVGGRVRRESGLPLVRQELLHISGFLK